MPWRSLSTDKYIVDEAITPGHLLGASALEQTQSVYLVQGKHQIDKLSHQEDRLQIQGPSFTISLELSEDRGSYMIHSWRNKTQ